MSSSIVSKAYRFTHPTHKYSLSYRKKEQHKFFVVLLKSSAEGALTVPCAACSCRVKCVNKHFGLSGAMARPGHQK